MDDKIKATLEKVIRLTKQNKEFGDELRKRLGIASSATSSSVDGNMIQEDVHLIREALEIRANKSLSYDFISYRRLKDQLIIDNLRMENAALNVTIDETERFYLYCVNAFYQVENIVNYYFYVLYPDIHELLTCIEQATLPEHESYRFKRNGKEQNVGAIVIADKLNAICNILFPGDKIKITLGRLKQVRNEGAHRCTIILQNQDTSNSLYKFYKYNTFNDIRQALFRLVNAVKHDIAMKMQPREFDAEITTILASACYVRVNGKITDIPNKFFSRIKNKRVGDKVKVVLEQNTIIEVKDA